jgi:diguanylate cyclase (GGDEF)-like protein
MVQQPSSSPPPATGTRPSRGRAVVRGAVGSLADWMLVAGVGLGAALGLLVALAAGAALLPGLLIGISSGAANVVLSRRLVGRRLRVLSGRMRDVAGALGGEGAAPGHVPDAGEDDLGRSARAFNEVIDALARSRRQATALRELQRACTASLDLGVIAHAALDRLLANTSATGGAILLLREDGGPDVIASAGVADAAALAQAPGCLTAVAQLRTVTAEIPSSVAVAGALGSTYSAAFLPALSGEEPVAILALTRHTPFDDELWRIFEPFAGTLGVAINNASAHRSTERLAISDSLTGLGNRRVLMDTLQRALAERTGRGSILALFDLNGFKSYNDTFGHPAGDALLVRLSEALAHAVAPRGAAYRLGGDEFCVLIAREHGDAEDVLEAAIDALSEHGDGFSITTAFGVAYLPEDAATAPDALKLADQRMYAQKQSARPSPGDQSAQVLVNALQARDPALTRHANEVGLLSEAVGRRLGIGGQALADLRRAAELHDIGKVAIPDAILDKPDPLDDAEWEFMRRHTVIGERILHGSPALKGAAEIVRASHEHFDGSGYPDALEGEQIPLGARIVLVCDAFDAMTDERVYQPPLTPEEAIEELRRCAGHQFDPRVVDAFCAALPELRLEASEAA